MHQSIVWILAGILALAGGSGTAHGRPALRGDVDIEIVTDGGERLRTIPFRTFREGRTAVVKEYLEALPDEQYGIVVRNRSSERVGLVIAVDGRNIITGGRSELSFSESMYIVEAGETARYDGWRTSRDEVHRFFFTGQEASYAVRTFGDSSAMGLIAVALFREKPSPRPRIGEKRTQSAPEAAAEKSAEDAGSRRAGTGFGNSAYAPVVMVKFAPERHPVRTTLLKYEWRATLCRKGIIRCGEDPANRLWDDAPFAPHPPAR